MLATMFAYDGWIHVGNIAGEMKNPKKHLPGAIALGIGLIMIVYLLINATFLMTLPIDQIVGNLNAASDASSILFGTYGGKIVTIGILISVYGTMNGYIMTGMRIPYAMAEHNQLPFRKFFLSLTPSKAPWTSGARASHYRDSDDGHRCLRYDYEHVDLCDLGFLLYGFPRSLYTSTSRA